MHLKRVIVIVDLIPDWEKDAVTYINKPSISGSFTYNTAAQTCSINEYDVSKMTQSGTTSATNAGTYTVTFTPKNGYAWADTKSKDAYACNWSIAKRKLAVPTLSTTSFTFDDANHSVSDKNYNSAYMNRSGTTTAKNQGTYTVTWALKNSSNCTWSDGSTGNKSATWKINWVNGKSHYSNDIYNRGWLAPGWEYGYKPNGGSAYSELVHSDHLSTNTDVTPLIQYAYDKTLQNIPEVPNFAIEYSKAKTTSHENYNVTFMAVWQPQVGGAGEAYKQARDGIKYTTGTITVNSDTSYRVSGRGIDFIDRYWTFRAYHNYDGVNANIYRIYWTNTASTGQVRN